MNFQGEYHIKLFQISLNNKYIFTLSHSNALRVWDFEFRGGFQPEYQEYLLQGEDYDEIILSNDDENLVFLVSLKRNKIETLYFKGDFSVADLDLDPCREEEILSV